jgi:hypothetical protein
MWSDVIPAANWALVWLLLTLPPFIFAQRLAAGPTSWLRTKFGRNAWLILPALALIIRLVPAIMLPVGAGYDIESFKLTGEALLSGEDVYTSAAIGRHPYFPFQMYFIALSLHLSRSSGIPFVVLIKMLPIFADAAITALIWHSAVRKGWSQVTAWWLAMLYAFNPISILVSAYHGQFDSVAVLLLFLAWYYWRFGQRLLLSSVALGMAVLNKTWPIVFLPIALIRMKRIRSTALYVIVSVGIPLILTAAYVMVMGSDPEPMIRRALTHTGNSGWWGITSILATSGQYFEPLAKAGDFYHDLRRWLLLIAGVLVLWRTRRQSALDALVTIILAAFAVTAGIGIQWLLWVVPFAIIARDTTWLRRYSLAALFLLIPHLFGLHLVPWAITWFGQEDAVFMLRLVNIPVWIVVVLWLFDRWRKAGPNHPETSEAVTAG